jgi:translation initiation factor 2 gamma subunit (eIF-2gamma)
MYTNDAYYCDTYIILQNKVDLVKPQQAEEQHEQIKNFVAGRCMLYENPHQILSF